MADIQPSSDKLGVAVRLLEEKLTREYDLTLEELRKSTVTIKNGQVSIKKGK